MRKITFLLLIILLISWKSHSQGSDVVICIDNSGSIDTTEYTQMKSSIDALITKALGCNASNRVSIVHYAHVNGYIWIESDFTNNSTTALTYSRRFGGNDFLYSSMQTLGDALDGINNSNIQSSQKTLSRNITNNLVVFIFTDAVRSSGGSYMVNDIASTLNSDASFQVFTDFKNNRGAKFVIVHQYSDGSYETPQYQNIEAGASIASRGGSYNYAYPGSGIIRSLEPHPNDPDGNNLPRFYLPKTDFIMTTSEIDDVSENICSISLTGNLNLNPVDGNCPLFPLDVTGTFNIPEGATISNIKLEILDSSGTVVNTLYNPLVSGNTFSFAVNQINFGTALPMTGDFEFRVFATVSLGSLETVISKASTNTGAPDVTFNNCCPNYLTISTNVLGGDTDQKQAHISIAATNLIDATGTGIYHAGKTVFLNPGFTAKPNSFFRAYIEDCQSSNKNESPESRIGQGINNNNWNPNEKIELNKVINKNLLSIYPNPANNQITINTGSDNDMIKSIKITSIDGREVIAQQNLNENASTYQMSISTITKGIYIVSIETSLGKIMIQKLVKN